jgi:hypothetical protein
VSLVHTREATDYEVFKCQLFCMASKEEGEKFEWNEQSLLHNDVTAEG